MISKADLGGISPAQNVRQHSVGGYMTRPQLFRPRLAIVSLPAYASRCARATVTPQLGAQTMYTLQTPAVSV